MPPATNCKACVVVSALVQLLTIFLKLFYFHHHILTEVIGKIIVILLDELGIATIILVLIGLWLVVIFSW